MTGEAFRKLTEQGVLLDGATGSNLMKAGKPVGVCSEQWILDHPQVLLELQRGYVEAGSQVVYAPTFTASAYYLKQHGLEDRLEQINADLVALSRKAVGDRAFVAGDLTTMADPSLDYAQLLEEYRRQAEALRAAGVDLYVIETMMGLEETMAALEACKLVSELPVLCTFSINADGMLYFGGSLYDAVRQLEEFGADALGVNCSFGPDQMEAVVRSLRDCLTVPVIAKPNAGMPQIDDLGHATYSMGPEEFAAHMVRLRDAGASILGGCCGTEPSYIAALRRSLEKG